MLELVLEAIIWSTSGPEAATETAVLVYQVFLISELAVTPPVYLSACSVANWEKALQHLSHRLQLTAVLLPRSVSPGKFPKLGCELTTIMLLVCAALSPITK